MCDRGEKEGHQFICERDDLIEKKKNSVKKKKKKKLIWLMNNVLYFWRSTVAQNYFE